MLYHVTSQDNQASILKSGLQCKLGKHSAIAHEESPCIYACDKKDIAQWSILLGYARTPLIIEIDETKINPIKIDHFDYSSTSEYIIHEDIPAANCRILPSIILDEVTYNQAHRMLAKSYLFCLNDLCVQIMKQEHQREQNQITTKQLVENIQPFTPLVTAIQPIDFNQIAQEEYKELLIQEANDGEYMFTDTYYNGPYRLWQKLMDCSTDSLTPIRTQLYQILTTKFYGCLTINTGGLSD